MKVEKSVLGLQLPTDPRWTDLATKRIDDILTDHAYCEQKAASTCISLIITFNDYPEIVEKLSPLVTEEWGHFRLVLRELKRRGFELGPKRKDEYVNQLQKKLLIGGSRSQQLADRLLLSALIEARSAERFKLLSQDIADDDLKKFYYDLMASEAGHYRLFLDLAKSVFDEDFVKNRWKQWLSIEAEIIANLEVRGDRMH